MTAEEKYGEWKYSNYSGGRNLTTQSLEEIFIAGHASRDEEVEELKTKLTNSENEVDETYREFIQLCEEMLNTLSEYTDASRGEFRSYKQELAKLKGKV